MKFNLGLNSLIKRIGLVPSVLLVLGFLSLIGGNKIWSGFFLSSAIAWYYMATSTSSIGYYPDPSVTIWDKKRAAIAIMFGLFAIVSLACAQSEEPKRKTFHVTEVRQVNADDYCTTGQCSAAKIEVSGLALNDNHRTISYNLECVEVLQLPQSKTASMLCIHVQAGEDYPVKIYPTAIMFGENQHVEGADIVLYNIISQREKHEPSNHK